MKKLILISALLLIGAFNLQAQLVEKRAAAVVTTSYVASTETAGDDHQFTVEVIVSGTGEAVTASLIPQWSSDNVNWIDEPVNISGTASATEQPYTRVSKRFDFSLSATGLAFSETFNRWGNNRYFRVKIKGGSATTTALVQIKVGTSKYAR
jgi:hypothetical protein